MTILLGIPWFQRQCRPHVFIYRADAADRLVMGLPDRNRLDPSAAPAGFARRRLEASGTGGYAVGTETAGGNQLGDIPILALGTHGKGIIGGQKKLLELVGTAIAYEFVNRHRPPPYFDDPPDCFEA